MFTLIKHAIAMRRSASVATFASVALAAAVVFAMALAALGVHGGLEVTRERLGADLMVVPASAAADLDENQLLFTGAPVNIYMDADFEERVGQLPGVERVTPQFFGQTLDASCCSTSKPSRLVGFVPESDWVLAPWASESGEQTISGMQIVAGIDIAGDFRQGGKVLGHNVELVSTLAETGTDLDGSIFMDIDSVRSLARDSEGLAELWEENGDPATLISCLLVDVEDAQLDAVKKTIANMEGVAVVDSNSTIAAFSDEIGAVFRVMAGAAALLVAATLFQLFARFFSLAWDRRGELALYRALGASKREVARMIAGEAGLLVGGGVLVGLVLGALLYLAVPSLLAGLGTFPYMTPGPLTVALVALGTVALFALVGFAAVAWPLTRAGRIDPVSAMQAGDIE